MSILKRIVNGIFTHSKQRTEDNSGMASAKKGSDTISGHLIPKGEHPVSVNDFSDNALSVLRRLNSKGYDAYLVGGCIRDRLMGIEPKDFDVVTNATPEQIKAAFSNCRLIGRRFRLAHILFGRDIIEVATFRGHHPEEGNDHASSNHSKQDADGQLLRDNVFGTIEEDAERRDFTFNAMYFSAKDQSILDFAKGADSIKRKEIALIGDPETRFREDPVRMLRAIRFAAKLNMTIAPAMQQCIRDLGHLLSNIPPARLFEEILKLFVSGNALTTYDLLNEYALFEHLFPQLSPLLSDKTGRENEFIRKMLINTDNRINTQQRVTPAFLLAAFMWYPLEERSAQITSETDMAPHDAFTIAMSEVLQRQIQRIMIPKRYSIAIREIWQLQHRLPRRFGKRAYQLLAHPRFRAAYDFLLIRGEIEGGELLELGEWWTEFQEASPSSRKKALITLHASENNVKRPRKYKKKTKA